LGSIAATVRKTNRAIVAYEDTLSWGYGAEIAARIGEQLFDQLDAPVRRVAAMALSVRTIPILKMKFFRKLPIWSLPSRNCWPIDAHKMFSAV